MLDPVGGSVAKNTGSVASAKGVLATGKRKASPSSAVSDPKKGQGSTNLWLILLLILRLLSWWHLPQIQGNKGAECINLIFWIPWCYLFKPLYSGWKFRQKRHKETEPRGHLDVMMMCFKHVLFFLFGYHLKSHNETKPGWQRVQKQHLYLYICQVMTSLHKRMYGSKKQSLKMLICMNCSWPPGTWCRDVDEKHQESLRKHSWQIRTDINIVSLWKDQSTFNPLDSQSLGHTSLVL